MNRYEKAMKLKDEDFKQILGVKKESYNAMTEVLSKAYAEKHKRRGRQAGLSIEDQLFPTLKYWRRYVTQKELSFEFEVGEATVNAVISWVEKHAYKERCVSSALQKALLEDNEIEMVPVDVTESLIERPKKNGAQGIRVKRNGTP